MFTSKNGICNAVDKEYLNEEEYRKKFAKRFTTVLVEKDVTYKQLAEATDIFYTTIKCYATGRAMPTFYRIQLIADALGCSTDEFRV